MNTAKKAIKSVVEGKDPKDAINEAAKSSISTTDVDPKVLAKAKKKGESIGNWLYKNSYATDKAIYLGDMIFEAAEEIVDYEGDDDDEEADRLYEHELDLASTYIYYYAAKQLAMKFAKDLKLPSSPSK